MITDSTTPAVSTFRINSPKDLLTLPVSNGLRERIKALVEKAILRAASNAKVGLSMLEMAVSSQPGVKFASEAGLVLAVKVDLPKTGGFSQTMMALYSGEGVVVYQFDVCSGLHVHLVWDIEVSATRIVAKPVLKGKILQGEMSAFPMEDITSYLGISAVYDSGLSIEALPYHPSLAWALDREVEDLMAAVMPQVASQAGLAFISMDDAVMVMERLGLDVGEIEEPLLASSLFAQYVANDEK